MGESRAVGRLQLWRSDEDPEALLVCEGSADLAGPLGFGPLVPIVRLPQLCRAAIAAGVDVVIRAGHPPLA